MRHLWFILLVLIGCEPALDVCSNIPADLIKTNQSKNYILFASKDDIDDADLNVLDQGLSCQGWNRTEVNKQSTINDATSYLQSDMDLIYYTGHGYANKIYVDDILLHLDTLRTKAKNIILSSCFTLSYPDTAIKMADKVPYSIYIMGYVAPIFDEDDKKIAVDMLTFMKSNISIPRAFQLANVKSKNLVWVIYQIETYILNEHVIKSIKEYGPRNGISYKG